MSGNQHGFLCPDCKRGDSLQINANVWVELHPDGTEQAEGDTEWDDTSLAKCTACTWSGAVVDLITEKAKEEPSDE